MREIQYADLASDQIITLIGNGDYDGMDGPGIRFEGTKAKFEEEVLNRKDFEVDGESFNAWEEARNYVQGDGGETAIMTIIKDNKLFIVIYE